MRRRAKASTPAEVVRTLAWDLKVRASAFAARAESYTPEECEAILASLARSGAVLVADGAAEAPLTAALVAAMNEAAEVPMTLATRKVVEAEGERKARRAVA